MDLSVLQTMLAGLGPWGILAGFGLGVLAKWLQVRQPGPKPGPGPAPSPTPLKDWVLAWISDRLSKPKAVESAGEDLTPEQVVELMKSLGK